MPIKKSSLKKRKITPEDFNFLMGTGIFRAVPDEGKNRVMACLAPATIRAGERFIEQGQHADCLYLIQSGSCSVKEERDGAVTAVGRPKPGELVGEMSLLTGDFRTAHVDAETDMKMWRMSRVEFDELCLAFPGVREFVTALVTRRISHSKFTPHKTIGKYVITDTLDEGGWGIVYKAVHDSLNLPVAVKMLKHAMAMDPDFTSKFENEAQVIARLNHPNIVRVYDIEHLYRTIFIVMEYVVGQSLKDVLTNAVRLPPARAVNFLIQVAEGLEYAHQQGIVHGDIKPDNLLVGNNDRVKIVDFGLSCPAGTGDDSDLVGTPYYMAPEQVYGDAMDERTDIYSLGITAFEIFTGHKPFLGPNVGDILQAHKQRPLPDPCAINPDLPPTFKDFMERATRKDPADRHQSMKEVMAHLKALLGEPLSGELSAESARREDVVLLISYGNVDRRELTRVLEDFGESVKELGAELSVASFDKR